MIRVYKYLKKEEYAQKMINEWEIRIGTLSEYREIEDESRADNHEGEKITSTYFDKEEVISNKQDREKQTCFENSNISYQEGTVKILAGTTLQKNESILDAYIYSTSKTYSKKLKEKRWDFCVEIFDIEKFTNILQQHLYELWHIYENSWSYWEIKYIWHAHDARNQIEPSGERLKDTQYANEAELRFRFIPILKKDGITIVHSRNEKGSFNFPSNHDSIKLEPLIIKCQDLNSCCRII